MSDEQDSDRIEALEKSGHTYHCAAGQVWGCGECTCPGDGTGSPYHTMCPPPGGWKTPQVPVPFGPSEALRRLCKHQRITMGEAAETLGLTVAQFSGLRSGDFVVEVDGG